MSMNNLKRPGIYRTTVNRSPQVTAATASAGTTGGGGSAAGVLKCSDDGVLIYTGAAPKMDGTTLVYIPTPAMADTVMTIS